MGPTSANPYGHTGIVLSATQTKITVADQNFANVKHTIGYYNSYGNVKGWIRPKYTTSSKPQPSKKQFKVYSVNDMKKVNGVWQVRCNSLAPSGFNWTDNGIGVGDIDEVNANGVKTKDQVFQKGSHSIFKASNVKALTKAQKGTGGYYWMQFKMPHTGNVWLATKSTNGLIYK